MDDEGHKYQELRYGWALVFGAVLEQIDHAGTIC
jgi:hypothetical protein